MQHDLEGSDYKRGSITLGGAVAMGTGVMIGAGIFALTGQVAELSGSLLPLAFLIGASCGPLRSWAGRWCRSSLSP